MVPKMLSMRNLIGQTASRTINYNRVNRPENDRYVASISKSILRKRNISHYFFRVTLHWFLPNGKKFSEKRDES